MRNKDLQANPQVWARFYRDHKTLEEIAEEFNCSIYNLSPWIYSSLISGAAGIQSGLIKNLEDDNARLKKMTKDCETLFERLKLECETVIPGNDELDKNLEDWDLYDLVISGLEIINGGQAL